MFDCLNYGNSLKLRMNHHITVEANSLDVNIWFINQYDGIYVTRCASIRPASTLAVCKLLVLTAAEETRYDRIQMLWINESTSNRVVRFKHITANLFVMVFNINCFVDLDISTNVVKFVFNLNFKRNRLNSYLFLRYCVICRWRCATILDVVRARAKTFQIKVRSKPHWRLN